MPVGAAIGVGSALSAGAQIIGGDRAADATRDAANSSNALQRYIYDQNRADLAPWRETGSAALSQLGQLYGLNGQPADTSGFQASPDYQFRFTQGLNALDRSAASRGGLYSGQQLRAAQDYGQGAASQEFGNYFNRLAGIAGVGQAATNQTGMYGQNYANQAGQNYLNAGNAQASSYLNRSNALSGFLGDAAYGYGRAADQNRLTGTWNF